jgi:hypothetical protein
MSANDKACRNCGSFESYVQEVSARGGYGPDLLPIGLFSMPTFHMHICGSCGLIDWYVSPKYLYDVKKKFSRER